MTKNEQKDFNLVFVVHDIPTTSKSECGNSQNITE